MEQVHGISEPPQSMMSEMRSMREKIDSQYHEICQLQRNADALRIELRQEQGHNRREEQAHFRVGRKTVEIRDARDELWQQQHPSNEGEDEGRGRPQNRNPAQAKR